jgi:hypothetical protein
MINTGGLCMNWDELNLEPIKFQLIVKEGWSLERADRVANEYVSNWQIIKAGASEIIPTQEVDEFWHTHILDTKKYAADCEKFLGQFLHHFPYLGLRGVEDYKDWREKVNQTINDEGAKITTEMTTRPGRVEIEEFLKEKVLPGWEGKRLDRRNNSH